MRKPHRQVNRQFDMFGETVEVYAKVEAGSNDFSNPEWDWRHAGYATVIFSNTTDSYQTSEPGAEYDTNEQNVYIRREEEPPTSDARIKRIEKDGRFFQMRTATRHNSHTQYRVREVRDDVPVEKYSTEPYE